MPDVIVRILGDDRSLSAAYRRAAANSGRFEKDVGKATRGALAGSGAFKSLGRSIAFASGGFLAFASAGAFLRKSIDAARDAQVTQKQLAAQFAASGKNLAQYQERIDRTADRLSLLAGIENDELKAGFIIIFRTTGNVSKALRDLGTAADLARAKHLGLNQAALIIAKTEAGNTTLLRRQGFQIKQNATAEEALAKVRRVVAGQAKAGTTAQERFGAVLHNTEEIIGAALLPTLNKYLTSGAKWLTQMNESGRLQKDVAAVTRDLGQAIKGVEAVLKPFVTLFKNLGDAVGGTRNEVKLLTAAFVAFKLRATAINFGLLAAGFGSTGAAAGTAATRVNALRASLLGIAKIGAITIPLIIAPKIAGSKLGKKFGLDFSGIDLGKTILNAAGVDVRSSQTPRGPFLGDKAMGDITRPTSPPNFFAAPGAAFQNLPTVQPLNPAQQRAIGLSGNPSLAALRAQAAFDRTQIAAIEKRRRAGIISAKTYTDEIVNFRNDLAAQEAQIATITEEASRKAKEAAKAAAARAKKALTAVADSARALLQGSLEPGFLAFLRASDQRRAAIRRQSAARAAAARQFNVPLALQLAVAQAALTKPTADDAAALRAIETAARKALRSHRLGIQGQIDALNTIKDVWDQLAGISKSTISGYAAVSTRTLTAGLDLTRAQRSSLEGRLAQAAAHGGRAPIGVGALGSVVITGDVHVTAPDINTLHDQLLKKAKRGAGQRRGGNAGSYMGLH